MRIFINLIVLVLSLYNAALANESDWMAYKDYKYISNAIDNVMGAMNTIAQIQPEYVKFISLGESDSVTADYPPEIITALLISSGAGQAHGNTTGKPSIIITGAIHAREWISVEFALDLAEYLASNATSHEPLFGLKGMTIKSLLENVEVVIIPVLNPAGYRYSRNEHRRATCSTCTPYVSFPKKETC